MEVNIQTLLINGAIMKLTILFNSLLILFYYQIFSYSQSDSAEVDYRHAIQFYVIDEIIAAYKYNFAENSALRFTVNATGLFTDKETERNEEINRTYDSLNYYENIQNISSNQFYEVKVQYLYELHLNKIVTIFFGGGPFGTLEFNHREDSRTVKYYNSNYEDVSSAVWSFTETIWSAGLSVLIGLECKVYENINLFTEYEARVSKGWQNDEDILPDNKYERSSDLWTYELRGLRIGLSVYF